MTALLKLVEYRCRDTIAVAKFLLSIALQGKTRGMVVCYKDDEGEEHTLFTGTYKESPNRAAGASLRMGLHLMRANGELD